jgi:NAD(P)-dependent dehydrogenase (short-subunit alcohol dehydrogenase family)
VLITGAGSGGGLVTARQLASCGFTVFAGIYRPEEKEEFEERTEHESGGRIIPVPIDITSDESVEALRFFIVIVAIFVFN